tara:strand:+ start:588 stop:1268 length:681 start_codon:yes stop_codon:yes gene_type:complete
LLIDTIVIIPARGGSKGIPGKNIKLFNGIPLINYSIKYALSVIPNNQIYISTDSEEIKDIVYEFGVKTIDRPDEISGDIATTESAISHVLSSIDIKPKNIVLLQATSPLRPKNSLKTLIQYFEENDFDSLLTISSTHRFFWELDGKNALPHYDFENRPRRQDMKEAEMKYIENGSVYMFSYNHFIEYNNRLGGKIGYYIFPEECAFEIDSISDWIALEQIAKLNKY